MRQERINRKLECDISMQVYSEANRSNFSSFHIKAPSYKVEVCCEGSSQSRLVEIVMQVCPEVNHSNLPSFHIEAPICKVQV